MTYTVLKFEDNYADEFDVEGFVVVKSEFAEKWKELVGSFEDSFSFGFGSNEANDYDNGADFVSNITSVVITKEEAIVLANIFKNKGEYCNVITKYGIADYFYECLLDIMGENGVDISTLINEN